MERSVRPRAPRIVLTVLARVPTVAGHVDAAAKCEIFVDRDQFLMMRSSRGMVPVELGVNPQVSHPFHDRQKSRASHQRLDRADVPTQQIDFEIRGTFDEPVQELTHAAGLAGQPLVGDQLDPRIEIPADEHDAAFGLQESFARMTKISVGIDDDRKPVGNRAPPAVFPVDKQPHGAVMRQHNETHKRANACRARKRARRNDAPPIRPASPI